MGFDSKWVSWMLICVNFVSYSVLVNKIPMGQIQSGRGLRHECPLSPYLFIMCSEGLIALINQSTTTGDVHGNGQVPWTGKYLGLPSMIGKSKKAMFKFIKDRV